MKFKFSLPKTVDWWLYILPLILVLASVVVIYSLTFYNNKIALAYNQIVYGAIGLVLMVVFTFIDYRNWKSVAPYLYLAVLSLLVIVLFWGKGVFGATRWIDLKVFQLQPAEIFKIILIIFLARYFSDRIGNIRFRDILFTILITIIPSWLVFQQPDFGTMCVFLIIAIVIVSATRLKKVQIFAIIFIILVSLPGTWFLLKDYQKQRIHTFLNPTADQFGAGYNVRQSIIAVGSGGFLGKGLGHGPQSQLNFLPIVHTDFIFAGLAEASGLLGSAIFIVLYLFMVSRVIGIAKISRDGFGMLLAIGASSMFIFQGFVNIGMNLGIMPVTGIPLPFLSSGGTALIVNMATIGILQSIYLRHKKITF